jgi:hypothetical protein
MEGSDVIGLFVLFKNSEYVAYQQRHNTSKYLAQMQRSLSARLAYVLDMLTYSFILVAYHQLLSGSGDVVSRVLYYTRTSCDFTTFTNEKAIIRTARQMMITDNLLLTIR